MSAGGWRLAHGGWRRALKRDAEEAAAKQRLGLSQLRLASSTSESAATEQQAAAADQQVSLPKLEFTACGPFLELAEERTKVVNKAGEVDPGESKLPRPFGLPKRATWLALPENTAGGITGSRKPGSGKGSLTGEFGEANSPALDKYLSSMSKAGPRHRPEEFSWQSALCASAPMSSGRHYAEFEIVQGHQVLLGVALPNLSLSKQAHMTAQFWGINANGGMLQHAGVYHEWEGAKGFGVDDTIGLSLDCDAGRLTVFANGKRSGVAVRGGLQGKTLCWAVSLCGGLFPEPDQLAEGGPQWRIPAQPNGQAVRITAKPPPPNPDTPLMQKPPTAQQLAQWTAEDFYVVKEGDTFESIVAALGEERLGVESWWRRECEPLTSSVCRLVRSDGTFLSIDLLFF